MLYYTNMLFHYPKKRGNFLEFTSKSEPCNTLNVLKKKMLTYKMNVEYNDVSRAWMPRLLVKEVSETSFVTCGHTASIRIYLRWWGAVSNGDPEYRNA